MAGENLTPAQFAARVRSKYPGDYDDLDDETLTAKFLTKYPVYKDMLAAPTAAEQPPNGSQTAPEPTTDNQQPGNPPLSVAARARQRLAEWRTSPEREKWQAFYDRAGLPGHERIGAPPLFHDPSSAEALASGTANLIGGIGTGLAGLMTVPADLLTHGAELLDTSKSFVKGGVVRKVLNPKGEAFPLTRLADEAGRDAAAKIKAALGVGDDVINDMGDEVNFIAGTVLAPGPEVMQARPREAFVPFRPKSTGRPSGAPTARAVTSATEGGAEAANRAVLSATPEEAALLEEAGIAQERAVKPPPAATDADVVQAAQAARGSARSTAVAVRPRRMPKLTASAEPFNPDAYVKAQVAARETARKSGEAGESLLKHAKRKLVDSNAPIEDVLAAAVKDSKGKIKIKPSEDITNAIDRVYRAPSIAGQFARDNGLESVIKEAPNLEKLDQFLIARHAPENEALGFATGRDASADHALVDALGAEYGPIADKVTAYGQKLLDYIVDSGLISAKNAAELKVLYPNYVPMERVFTAIEAAGGDLGGAKAVASLSSQTVVRKLKGSLREIESPIEALLAKTNDAFLQGERNKAAKMLAGYAELPGNPFELKPLRTAANVNKRFEILDDLSRLGKEQRKFRRMETSTKGQLRATDRVLKGQFDRANKLIAESSNESQKVYDELRVLAADFDAGGTIDDLLKVSATRDAEISRLQQRIYDLTHKGDRLYGEAATAAADGRSATSAANRGFQNERTLHRAEGRYDVAAEDAFDDSIDGAAAAQDAAEARLERRGLRAERRLYELQGRREQIDYGSVAERRNDLKATTEALELAITERSKTVKALREELFSRRDVQTKAGRGTFQFLNDGVKEVWETTPEIAKAAKSLDVQRLGILGRILSAPVRVARVGITGVNPAFLAANVVRDQMTVLVNSPRGITTLANPKVFGESLWQALGHGSTYEEMMREGALGTSFDLSRSQVPKTVARIRAERSAVTRAGYVARHPAQLLREAEDLLARGEEFTRIQQYVAEKQAALKSGLPEAEARIAAARAARENSVNFARRGEWGTVLNSTFLYLNAGIQGSRTLVRNFAARPGATSGKIAAFVMLPVFTAAAWNMSDPARRKAYEDIPDYEKDNNLILVPPIPVQDAKGRYEVVKLPLAQNLSSLTIVARRTAEQLFGADPLTGGQVAEALYGTVSPIGSSKGAIASTVVPQGAKLVAEPIIGEGGMDIFTGREIVPQSPSRRAQAEEERTGATSKAVGKFLDTSPLQVEHFVKASTGQTGTILMNSVERALQAMGVLPKQPEGGERIEEAITRRFTRAAGGETERRARKKAKGN